MVVFDCDSFAGRLSAAHNNKHTQDTHLQLHRKDSGSLDHLFGSKIETL